MSQIVKLSFAVSVLIIVLLSLAQGSLAFKLTHKEKKENTRLDEEPIQKPLTEKQVNEINYCIMGCVKCANGDIYFKDESVSYF